MRPTHPPPDLTLDDGPIPESLLSTLSQFLAPHYPFSHPQETISFTAADSDAKILNLWRQFDDPSTGPSVSRTLNTAKSIAQHRRITSSPNTLAVYADGSCALKTIAVGIAVPHHQHIAMFSTDALGIRTRIHSALSELLAIVLGLEAGARLAAPGQHLAIFTDCKGQHWALEPARIAAEPAIGQTLRRLAAALDLLRERDIIPKIYWLGRDYQIPGNMVAHRAANRACQLGPLEYTVLSWERWREKVIRDALAEARTPVLDPRPGRSLRKVRRKAQAQAQGEGQGQGQGKTPPRGIRRRHLAKICRLALQQARRMAVLSEGVFLEDLERAGRGAEGTAVS
ncbi:MAG: hypothetical protein M1828_004272 [Chrysothrix sp. TS-e1954]|nr:MAG: hypothetical protein M1828_004272 [Chrysothrix sp. TS-e1954]